MPWPQFPGAEIKRPLAGEPAKSMNKFLQLYKRLLSAQGQLNWWPATEPFEVAVGAILTQNTSWTGVEAAIANLKAADLMTPAKIADLPIEELARYIRPSGYFNIKAKRLKSLIKFIIGDLDGDVTNLANMPLHHGRKALLAVNGVGPETADSILLYCANLPIFVIDAYTRRLVGRLEIADPTLPYDELRILFESNLPYMPEIFNEFHAQIVIHCKNSCKKQPLCANCPILDMCAYGTRQGVKQ